jgi:16S rRNA (cytosine967-C5)-methyltransferase
LRKLTFSRAFADTAVTPAARVAAAAAVLDRIADGAAAEKALTNWARGSRFAGSGDRAAVRDLVFGALRRRRSLAARAGAADVATGNAVTGRQLMLGACLADGVDPAAVFTGQGHAPAPLSAGERAALDAATPEAGWPEAVALDCPDWILPQLCAALGPDTARVLRAMQARAPVCLRVNIARVTRDAAALVLAADNIRTAPHPLADTALTVTEGAARLRLAAAYLDGRVELQDAASQAATAAIPLHPGDRVLDYCAGGGGKTLALAARQPAAIYHAHDADPARMADLPPRAARAGVAVTCLDAAAAARGAPYDLVVVDAPCSGSGTWARTPDAKWRLSPGRLADLIALQARILDAAAALVRPGGRLAYMTCSLLADENEAQIDVFRSARPGWAILSQTRFTPLQGGDGFHMTCLSAPQAA